MDFARPRPRRPSEPALPMINVVFLLLIFFLMSAQIAPPPPLELTPPRANGETPASGAQVLYISRDGALAYGTARDETVWPMLTELAQSQDQSLLIRADARLDAGELARILARLSAMGLTDLRLATVPR